MILVLSDMKFPYQISKIVNTPFLLEVRVSYIVEVSNYHTNRRLTFEYFISYDCFRCSVANITTHVHFARKALNFVHRVYIPY